MSLSPRLLETLGLSSKWGKKTERVCEAVSNSLSTSTCWEACVCSCLKHSVSWTHRKFTASRDVIVQGQLLFSALFFLVGRMLEREQGLRGCRNTAKGPYLRGFGGSPFCNVSEGCCSRVSCRTPLLPFTLVLTFPGRRAILKGPEAEQTPEEGHFPFQVRKGVYKKRNSEHGKLRPEG